MIMHRTSTNKANASQPIRVLFICHGNICRSPMSEFVMKDLVRKAGLEHTISIESAAMHRDELGGDTHPGTKGILDANGVPYAPRAARLVTKDDYSSFDYLIGMDRYNLADMQRLFKNDPEGKLSLLLDWAGYSRDIADPWYTGDFQTTFDDVDAGCIALLEHLKRVLASI